MKNRSCLTMALYLGACLQIVSDSRLAAQQSGHTAAVSAAPQQALDVTYIANEGFLIRGAGKKALIDAPIVAPPEANPPDTVKAITEGSQNTSPFIAPDESYLLFSSNRAGSLDANGDLYVSRRLADGGWTNPASLGEPVNSARQERLPSVSPDGKYLFFTRWTPDHDEDVFWVDAATIPALRPMTNPPQENRK